MDAAHQYFTSHFHPETNAIQLGSCKCGNTVFASLAALQNNRFEAFCNARTSHNWHKEIELAEEIRHLDGKKRTLKGRMLEEIDTWNTNREVAPGLHYAGKQLVLYNRQKQTVTVKEGPQGVEHEVGHDHSGGDAMDVDGPRKNELVDDMDVDEEIVRPDVARRKRRAVAAVPQWHAHLPGQAVEFDEDVDLDNVGAIIVIPSSDAVTTSGNEDKGKVAALVQLVRRACLRFGRDIIRDSAYLLAAWSIGDPVYFLPAAASVLPKYFYDLPPLLTHLVNPATMTLVANALQQDAMRNVIGYCTSTLGFHTTRGALTMTPIGQDAVLYNRVLEEAKNAMSNC